MNAPDQSLFRKEVFEERADRLHGDVNLSVPITWQIIGFLLFGALAAACLFVSFATYSRVKSVPGTVVLDRGVAPVASSRPGVIVRLPVRNGQRVEAGATLIEVRSEENSRAGRAASDRNLAFLVEEEASLKSQASLTSATAEAELLQVVKQIQSLQQESASLDQQIAVQRQLVASASNEVDLIREVANRGFISRRDVLAREEMLLTRRQQLAQLEQLKANKKASLAEAERSLSQIRAQANAQMSNLTSRRSELARAAVDVRADQGYVLTAPFAGTVTALTARAGQPVGGQQTLMIVVPEKATVQAELYIPTSAAGFLANGQEVKLAIDAFPYQQLGTVSGRISQIASTTVTNNDAAGSAAPVYLATVDIDRPWITAFGRRHHLVPGMTLSARIITDRRTLLEWLFEPAFAVRRR